MNGQFQAIISTHKHTLIKEHFLQLMTQVS